jgi:hypothetical protein
MNVYVATSFVNISEARFVMDALIKAGHGVTHDWTLAKVPDGFTEKERNAFLQECGRADYEGVMEADALVLINHDLARDAMAEFGAALGAGIPVFVLYPGRRESVFFHRATLVYSPGQLLEKLRAYDVGRYNCGNCDFPLMPHEPNAETAEVLRAALLGEGERKRFATREELWAALNEEDL